MIRRSLVLAALIASTALIGACSSMTAPHRDGGNPDSGGVDTLNCGGIIIIGSGGKTCSG